MATVSVRPHAESAADSVHYTSAQMNEMLLERIYEGQTPDDLIRRAWVGAPLVLALGLILAMARDRVDEATKGRGEGSRVRRWLRLEKDRAPAGLPDHAILRSRR
jgi:hypothetical protein